MFKFKKIFQEKCGRLDHQQFKSCLRALGYDLPMVDEGQPEPEFQRILDIVDPNRDGYVTLQEYMAFMISKETENIQSSEEIESAFRALSKEFRPYVTAEELYAVSLYVFGDYFSKFFSYRWSFRLNLIIRNIRCILFHNDCIY